MGGKGYVLANLSRRGLKVPPGVCITCEAYESFLDTTGLREKIASELARKDLGKMRWEELWDSSLRIRNLFARTTFPRKLRSELDRVLSRVFSDRPVAVRSSAPGEDSGRSSFAGLHDSFLNLRGREEIREKIKLVWASLWSDRALLYRRELGLDVEKSTIAVVVQELVKGDVSGICFGRSPANDSQAVIEAVWGLNQGLVDGKVEPDRWILDRESGRIISHSPARREKGVFPGEQGVEFKSLKKEQAESPPLRREEVAAVARLILPLENYLQGDTDFEWTIRAEELFLLQARPITTGRGEAGGEGKPWENEDRRPWYLSLSRNLENLQRLRQKIEQELIPEMEEENRRLEAVDLKPLDDRALAEEIRQRQRIRTRWKDIYWSEFIPFAHGIRLFGQVYNDALRPEDPYEFMSLLGTGKTESLKRNQALETLARMIREDRDLKSRLARGETGNKVFEKLLADFISNFGELSCGVSQCATGREGIVAIIRELAQAPARRQRPEKANLLEKYRESFPANRRKWAEEVLNLGRTSYRMRDDDNIHLARIEGQLLRALEEGRRRLRKGKKAGSREEMSGDEVTEVLEGKPRKKSATRKKQETKTPEPSIKPRRLIGQPAGPGLARGTVRLVREAGDLFGFQAGEILVTEAVEPEMTFVIPLAAGIIEQRGGMLIHGAIIAREYGIPCVTGVVEATQICRSGMEVTIDGFLGSVIIH